MKFATNCITLVFAVLFSAASSQAAVLAGWDFDGVDLDDSGYDSDFTIAGVKDTNIDSAALTLSQTVNHSTAGSSYGFKISSSSTTNNLADAITNGHYMQFSIAASSGYVLNLDTLEFYGQSTGDGANSVAVLSSIGGFNDSSAIATVTGIAGDTGGFDTDGSGFGAPINLKSSEFQGIQSVDFRIYGWDTTSGGGATAFRSLGGNDLIINGSVTAVPEPSSFGVLCLLSLFGFLFFRRRRALA